MRAEADNRNQRDIVPKVKEWLDASNQIQVKASGIEVEIENVKIGCFAIKSRFFLSKKVKKTAEAMKHLRDSCKFEEISVPARPASMAADPRGTSNEIDSRKQIEEEIMEDLRGGKIHMMGICGMGGIGKTTMAQKIMNRVKEKELFEEVVMVVISQEVRTFEIQCEIAEKLGLRLEEVSLSARACKLRARLMREKKILLILDDVWEKLNLEDLGIPLEVCTIVITSRNMDVITNMNAKAYTVKILFENEAWCLFRERVGTWVDDTNLLPIAKEIARECKGLPLALVIVGTTLKNEKDERIWKDALHQLKNSNPAAMPDVLRDVYNPLKLSYESLENQDARSLFLLCCLFGEDRDISLEYLTIYGMGLRMFDGIMSVEEARNRVRTLFKMLKGRSLLLDGCDENHAKMHDVVRDVAIVIASEEGRVDRNLSPTVFSIEQSTISCTWISVLGENINKLPVGLHYPNLRLLLINNYLVKLHLNFDPFFPEISTDLISSPSFKGIKELNVLSFVTSSFSALPNTIQLLKKLRTLYLYGCNLLETISGVGELSSLEILVCRHCNQIAELPWEIGGLKQLRLLEVYKCRSLKRIARGVISRFVQLEELMIVRSFSGWETKANGQQRDNATLCEIESLKNLTRLEIEIEDATLAAEEISLSSRIARYKIGLCGRRWSGSGPLGCYENSMHLNLEENDQITLGEWIHVFLTKTEYLRAMGKGAINLDIAQVQKVKTLIYKDSSTVSKLVNIKPGDEYDQSIDVFPHLESLELDNLSRLEEICDGPAPELSNSFRNLKQLTLHRLPELRHLWDRLHQNVSLRNLSSINIGKCDRLRKLFPLSMTKDGLVHLESLKIAYCSMMEEVFVDDENEKDGECHRVTLPKLKCLKLHHLASLTSFCKGNQTIEFPLLEKISIGNCEELRSLVSSWDSLNLTGSGDYFRVFCDQKVIFGTLKKITLWRCDGIKTLFSTSVAKNLVKLEKLFIRACKEMEKVIEDPEEILYEKSHQLFPSLLKLEFMYLPKLQSFCNWTCNLQLPSLEYVKIDRCHSLTSLTVKLVSTPKLQSIKMDSEEKDARDLNGAIKLHFEAYQHRLNSTA